MGPAKRHELLQDEAPAVQLRITAVLQRGTVQRAVQHIKSSYKWVRTLMGRASAHAGHKMLQVRPQAAQIDGGG